MVMVSMTAGFGGVPMHAQAASTSGKYGLTVSSDGTMELAGKPFYGYGVNLYTTFQKHLSNALDDTYKDEFALMKKYNIPFVRIPFSGYEASYYDVYDNQKDTLFSVMDDVVSEAEKTHIGIIVSLMWWDPALSARVGEMRSAMGNVNSKTMQYAKQYVADIVKRYVNRPGIWGWEIGNEYNLTADLCDKNLQNYLWPAGVASMPITPSGFNYYSSGELHTFYSEIAKEIRKYDSYRMIDSGNGDMRTASKAMHNASEKMNKTTHLWDIDWTTDTLNDFYDMNDYYTPDPLNTTCVHFQNGTNGSSNPSYIFNFNVWGRTVSTLDYLKEFVNAAKRARKGLYFGEMGDFIDMEAASDAATKFQQLVDWIDQAGVQISSTWQFTQSPTKLVASDVGIEGRKLNILSAKNLAYQSAGKQDISIAWTDARTSIPSQSTQQPASSSRGSTSTTKPGTKTTSNAAASGTQNASSAVSDLRIPVDQYLVSSSTKLTIHDDDSTIEIAKPVTLSIFRKSLKMRSGYTMQVSNAGGSELTEDTEVVSDGCAVLITSPDGKTRTFTVKIPSGESSAVSSKTSTTPKKNGFPVWAMVLLSLVFLGGAGAGVYFGVFHKRIH